MHITCQARKSLNIKISLSLFKVIAICLTAVFNKGKKMMQTTGEDLLSAVNIHERDSDLLPPSEIRQAIIKI